MNKGTHFNGQPMYGQLINLLDKEEILKFSRKYHGERYVKHFDAYQHLTVMLYWLYQFLPSLLGIKMAIYMTDLVQMLPYVVTIVVLIVVSMRKKKENQPPAHLGLAYFREER